MSDTNIMDSLKTGGDVQAETDSLGGFQVLESNVYDFKIMNAFITFANSKAMAFNLHAKNADGQEMNQQIYVTSGEAKGCKNYYINPKTEQKHYLPGFNTANAICLLTVGKELSDIATEDGVAEVYGEKTKVKLMKELIGQEISLGVIKQVVDKRAKNADSGEYEPTGETRTENEVDKVFRSRDGLTTVEIRAKLEIPEFKVKWLEKWEGQTRDKSTGGGSNGATEGAPKRETGKDAPKESLFA